MTSPSTHDGTTMDIDIDIKMDDTTMNEATLRADTEFSDVYEE